VTPFLALDANAFEEVLDVNLLGVFLSGRAVAARLVAANLPGAIVNVASVAALVGDAVEPAAHYNASKAGVIALTKQMAVELAGARIRVNCVCPGFIATPMLRITDDPERAAQTVRDGVPLGRIGAAEEVARVIAFLLSEAASYVTGVALPIDGGSTLL
jgi:3-oxoacyl-[acyl-carrier protein] reductase